MRVTVSTPQTGLGYFPGLAEARTLEVDSLPEPLAREIESCIAELAAEAKARVRNDSAAVRDAVVHSVVVERSDGRVQRFEGPPTAAMAKLVAGFRAGLRAAAERSSGASS
jgi:hypothetical protein